MSFRCFLFIAPSRPFSQKILHANCCNRVSNRALRPRRGRFGTLTHFRDSCSAERFAQRLCVCPIAPLQYQADRCPTSDLHCKSPFLTPDPAEELGRTDDYGQIWVCRTPFSCRDYCFHIGKCTNVPWRWLNRPPLADLLCSSKGGSASSWW